MAAVTNQECVGRKQHLFGTLPLRPVARHMGERTLPDYDDPPVVETVLGVQFAPLAGWSIPHFGLFWNTIKEQYPSFKVQPPVPGNIALSVGLEVGERAFRQLELSANAPVRCWFFNESRTRLIQLQNDRFMHNWIKGAPGQPYLHYEDVRPIFRAEWQRFISFLDEQQITKPGMLQCEVTYVNHIEREKGWESFADLPFVIAPWNGQGSTGFLPAPNAVAVNARYPIEEQGWLTLVLEPAIRNTDGKEIIQLRLTATTHVNSTDIELISERLDLGRTWVVSGFTDFTSPKIHSLWRRRI